MSQTTGIVYSTTPAELRPRFKAVCQATEQRFQNYQIRVHRSLSWWERARELDGSEHPDGRLLYGWIAFNSLYGVWDEASGGPSRDRETWQKFLSRVFQWDADGLLADLLKKHREQVLGLLENKYLDMQFWRRRDGASDGRRGRYSRGPSLFVERRWCELLILAYERIYVLRGQIVHGAATRGSRLNRDALGPAVEVLEAFLGPILHLSIEHGANDEWLPLCYPPIEESTARPIKPSFPP
jgi:hypothetical protein